MTVIHVLILNMYITAESSMYHAEAGSTNSSTSSVYYVQAGSTNSSTSSVYHVQASSTNSSLSSIYHVQASSTDSAVFPEHEMNPRDFPAHATVPGGKPVKAAQDGYTHSDRYLFTPVNPTSITTRALRYENVTIDTDELTHCLKTNDGLSIVAHEVSMSYDGLGDVSELDFPMNWTLVCNVSITGPSDLALSVLLTELTRTLPENTLSVSDGTSQELWDGCREFFFPGFDFVSSSNTVVVTLQIRNVTAPFSLRLNVKAVRRPGPGELEIRYVTPTLGKSEGIESGHWPQPRQLKTPYDESQTSSADKLADTNERENGRKNSNGNIQDTSSNKS